MTTEEIMHKAYELFKRKCELREFIGCGTHEMLSAGEAVALGVEMYRLGAEEAKKASGTICR